MKLISATFGLAAICAVGLCAQSSETKTTSKVKIKDGKDVTVAGCVRPMSSGTGFMLMKVADKSGPMHSYLLVADGGETEELSKHVGHLVQISGKATDRGDAKVETETKTKVKPEHGEDRESESKSEIKGDLSLPFLGVKSVKMIAAACP